MAIFRYELHSDLPVLVISGDLDFCSRAEFGDALAAIDARTQSVMVDFCCCDYFDGSVLSELVKFNNARLRQQHMFLSMPHPFAKQLLQITGLDRIFSVIECMHLAHPHRAQDELRERRLRRAAGITPEHKLVGNMPKRLR